MEWYLSPGLITEEEWMRRIGALRERAERTASPLPILKEGWIAAFEHAVLARGAQHDGRPVGVLFSGGIDSVLIAFVLHKHGIPFTCYTAGFQDAGTKEPEDIIEAQRVAAHFGWRHAFAVLGLAELEPVIGETVRILDDAANPVTVGVGAVEVAAIMLAKRDYVSVLFGGLGSEELFAGYERHGLSTDLHEECWRGLAHMHHRDLVRDARIAAALGVELCTPFLDEEVIALAMAMPASEKIKDGEKKHVLRAMAAVYGLPRPFAERPKRAAQYGSRFDGALERLGRPWGGKRGYISSLRAGQSGKR